MSPLIEIGIGIQHLSVAEPLPLYLNLGASLADLRYRDEPTAINEGIRFLPRSKSDFQPVNPRSESLGDKQRPATEHTGHKRHKDINLHRPVARSTDWCTPSNSMRPPSTPANHTSVTFNIAKSGGQIGSVKFRIGPQVIEPLHTAPWCGKPDAKKLIPLLRGLRGDFFCAPFGDGPAWRGEKHPPHGETANADWTVTSSSPERLVAELKTRIRPGKVTKVIESRPGETNLYQTHIFEGMQGRMCCGHHAMLDFNRNGPGILSTSKPHLAQVLPVPFESPAQGGYSSLKQGAWIRRLDKVPLAAGGQTDLTRYPAREGFEDLVMIHHKDSDDFAWSAVVFPEKKFVWFSLKNPAHLASTVLWYSNGGRHYAPWSGRHRGVLGVEDVTAYFHLGLGASLSRNPWTEKGVPTSLHFTRHKPARIPYIMGVAVLPDGFDSVRSIRRTATGIRLRSANGRLIDHTVDTSFIQ